MTMPSIAELIANSGSSAPAYFTKDSEVGDTITGTVSSVNVRQTVDPATREPQTWQDGTPRLQVVIELQTALRDDAEDDGIRTVYVKWWTHQRAAFLAAVADAGIDTLEDGDAFTATFVGIEKATRKGVNDTKLYAYSIARTV